MKIANEKNIKLSNFFYELLNTNYDNLEREFKGLGLDTDKIVFKINNNLSNTIDYYELIFDAFFTDVYSQVSYEPEYILGNLLFIPNRVLT